MTYYKGEKRKTLYLNPLNHEIKGILSKNATNKIAAAYGLKTEDSFDFICNELHTSDKVVTTFKNKIYITAWYGEFILNGHPQLLTLLYNTGIGDRNSQGFGMFDVI